VSGVLILHAVPPVGVGDKLEPESAIIPPLSTVEKTVNGLVQQMRQDLATLSTVQVNAVDNLFKMLLFCCKIVLIFLWQKAFWEDFCHYVMGLSE